MAWRLARAWLGLLAVVALAAASSPLAQAPAIARIFLVTQDLPVLAVILGFGLVLAVWMRDAGAPAPGLPQASWTGALALAGLSALVAFAGARWVTLAYPLSLDEFMATFDGAVLRSGRLMAPVAPEWRPMLDALQPIFRVEAPGGMAWTTQYLPMNALILGWLSPAVAGALWAAVAVAALYGVARRLWPDRQDAAAVAVLLLASGSQFLITAMTPYAMSAHLALNLVWLWLLLRGGVVGHVMAAAVAVIAMGLHQLVFHPLFAAPFVLQLWLSRRWGPAAFHTLVYGAAGLLWMSYLGIALAASGVEPATAQGAGSFIQRAVEHLDKFSLSGLAIMGLNGLRFLAWQNPHAVALVVLAMVPAIRAGGMVQALALGLLLTLAAMFVILPFQGHGWGYRYVHGLLGNVALLGGFAWMALLDEQGAPALRKAMAATLAVSVLVLLPVHALQVRDFTAPYARAHAAIEAAKADVVLIDSRGLWYGIDLVRNDPFLTRKPLVFDLASLDEAEVTDLCRTYRVAVFDRRQAPGVRPVQDIATAPHIRQMARLRAHMEQIGCGRPTG